MTQRYPWLVPATSALMLRVSSSGESATPASGVDSGQLTQSSGTLTHYRSDCAVDGVYNAGDNKPAAEDAPNPGCPSA
ncbi:hypothetical protein ACVWWN_002784 [Mycobacterium sp. URHB0021]|jgi:hypothetical protein